MLCQHSLLEVSLLGCCGKLLIGRCRWRHSTIKLPQVECQGKLLASRCCRSLGLEKLCLLQEPIELGSTLEAGSKTLSFCNVSPVPSAHKTFLGKGKIFTGPSLISTEQAKRVNLELKSNELVTGTPHNYLRTFRTLRKDIL